MRNTSIRSLCAILIVTGLFGMAATPSRGNPPPGGKEGVSNFATVATVKERDAIPKPADGCTVLLQASGNFHRWSPAGKTWEILNESNVVNVKDFGTSGSGSNDDDTDALVRAFQYASTHGLFGHGGLRNYFCPVTIFFPPGTYRVTRPISEHGALQGTNLMGNGAKIVGPGKDKPLFDTSDHPGISTRISGLTFENFKNVIRCWLPKLNNAWAGTVTFENCRFSGGDYVMVSYRTPNLYPTFSNINIAYCNLFKGMADSVFINNVTGATADSSSVHGARAEEWRMASRLAKGRDSLSTMS